MKKLREDEIRIATEAARWQHALPTADAAGLAEFADWVKASPRHLQEFMVMEGLDSAAHGIDPDKKIDIDLNFSREERNVTPLPRTATNPAPARQRWRLRAAIAASVLAVALGLAWWSSPGVLNGWDRYATAVGDQRTIKLGDGSVIELNARSRVRVRFGAHSRDVQSEKGVLDPWRL